MNFNRLAFWKDPLHSGYPFEVVKNCDPLYYLDLGRVTDLMVSTIQRYATPEMTILELGCGTGRNLAGLSLAGFTHLAGVELNPQAVELGRGRFPNFANIPVTLAAVEDVIIDLAPVDVIFTQGFLMHLPPELEWVIAVVRTKARKAIIINEGERAPSFHAWRHDYAGIIGATGEWQQVYAHTAEAFPPLPKTTITRVFLRKGSEITPATPKAGSKSRAKK